MNLMEKLQQQLKEVFAEKLAAFPPEVREAMEKTRVRLVRKPGLIEISIDSQGDSGVEMFRDLFLGSLLNPLCGIITLFGCEVDVNVDLPLAQAEDSTVEG